MIAHKPLEGIRVVELTTAVAAPSVGRILTHLGAESIKVEPPKGEDHRRFGPSYNCPATEEENPCFDVFNGCKKSIAIDLKSEKGLEVMLNLLSTADIFVTNTRAKALTKLGLDKDLLRKKFPRLIIARVTGYGEVGPDKDLPGYDTTAFWAKSGFVTDMAIIGDSYLPTAFPGGFGDLTTGLNLSCALLSALYAREKTGEGDYVTCSLYGTALWGLSLMLVAAQEPYGKKYPMSRYTASPTPYCCKDGEWIVFSVLSNFEKQMSGAARAIGRPDLIDDPRFVPKSNFLKPENMEAFIKIFEEAFKEKTSDEWMELLNANDIAAAKISHFRDAANTEQAFANHYSYRHKMPSGNTCVMPLPSMGSENSGDPVFARAPLLGEHSVAILKDLGYKDNEIAEIVDAGAVIAHK